MTKNSKLPPYFKEYLDERFKRVEENIEEIKELLSGKNGICEKVEQHEIWIKEFTGKITIIVSALGTIFGLIFTIAKDFFINFFRK